MQLTGCALKQTRARFISRVSKPVWLETTVHCSPKGSIAADCGQEMQKLVKAQIKHVLTAWLV